MKLYKRFLLIRFLIFYSTFVFSQNVVYIDLTGKSKEHENKAEQYDVLLTRTQKGQEEQIIKHFGYIVSYNQNWLQPNWVSWCLTQDETKGTISRSGVFCPDPLVNGISASTYDYSRSGYDRGHMAPAGDMKWSQQSMEESFYLSNICPQNHELNSGLWEDLETRCRGWAKFHGQVWICCGPIVSSTHNSIGDNKVAVPDKFFKVVCLERKGKYYAIGFIMPNNSISGNIWQYACTVDDVEAMTGHDFFYALPDDNENAMEASVNIKLWQSN